MADENAPLLRGGINDAEPPVREKRGTLVTSIFNLANAAIGAGILSFPYAYESTGLIAGVVITLLMVGLMIISLKTVAEATEITKSSSYQQLVEDLYGKKVAIVCEVILLLYLIGACIAYMTIIGDMGAPVAQHWGGKHFYTTREFIIAAFSILVVFPLTLLKRVDVLGMASIFAILSCTYLAGFITADGIDEFVKIKFEQVVMERFTLDFFSAFPLICFAFQCQILVPPVYAELKGVTLRKFDIVIVAALSICTLLYMPVGFFGYIKFGDRTQGDILLSFDVSSIPAAIGRICIAFTVTMAYPINNFPARLTVGTLFFKGKDIYNSPLHFYGITVVLFVLNLIIAIFAPGVTIVFTLIGATLGVAVIFIFPSMFAWKIKERKTSAASKRFLEFGATILFLVGMFIAVTGTFIIIYKKIHHLN